MKFYKQFPEHHPAIKPALDAFGWEGKGIMDKLTQLVQESGEFVLDVSVLQRNFGFNARKCNRILPILQECFLELLKEFGINSKISANIPKDSKVSQCLPKFHDVSESFAKHDAQNQHGSTRDQEENREEENRKKEITPPPVEVREERVNGQGVFFEIELHGQSMTEQEWIYRCLMEHRRSKGLKSMGATDLNSLLTLYPTHYPEYRRWATLPMPKRIAGFALTVLECSPDNQFKLATAIAEERKPSTKYHEYLKHAEEQVAQKDYLVRING